MVVVAGPTGSGKSALALELAARFGGEIINADSLQIYRGFDIGTAKTPVAERRGVPHHLFDVREPQEGYSAGEYARAARDVLREVSARGRIPIVAGGTGFYLRALLEGLPSLPERDAALRERLASKEARTPGKLHRLLARLDPRAAARIHANDVQKLTRALEIRLSTGAPLAAREQADELAGYRALLIGLNPYRAELNQRLDRRVQTMFENGLLDEIRALLARGVTGEEKPFESLGYKQALAHLRRQLTREEAIASTQAETRQYAKRQLTWFRRDPEIHWFDGFGDDPGIQAAAAELLRGALERPSATTP